MPLYLLFENASGFGLFERVKSEVSMFDCIICAKDQVLNVPVQQRNTMMEGDCFIYRDVIREMIYFGTWFHGESGLVGLAYE